MRSKQQKHPQYPRLDASGGEAGSAVASISGVGRQPKRTTASAARPPATTMDDIGGGGGGGDGGGVGGVGVDGGDDADDDQQMLLNIEQNIVNLERSLGQTDAIIKCM